MNEAFLWSKLNLEWLTVTSPYMTHRVGDEWLIFRSPYVGTGVVAGYADYPFYFGGDTEVSIMGLLTSGLHETAKDALRLLGAIAKKQNGRVPHNVPTNGAVYDPGYLGETPRFVRSVWDTYRWAGDEAFLKQMYPICKMCILDYLFSQPRENGLLLTETGDSPDQPRAKGNPFRPLAGLLDMAKMAERMDDAETARRCHSEADLMKRNLEQLFWVKDQSLYARYLGANNKPMPDEAHQFWTYMDATLSVTYEGLADASRAARALARIEGKPFSSAYGIWLAREAPSCPTPQAKPLWQSSITEGSTKGCGSCEPLPGPWVITGSVPGNDRRIGDPRKFYLDGRSCSYGRHRTWHTGWSGDFFVLSRTRRAAE